MSDKPKYAVILVYSISHAIRIEKALKKEGIEVKLIPTPRQYSSDCGSAVRIPVADRPLCEQVIGRMNMRYQDILDLE